MLPRRKLIPLKSEFGRIRADGKLYDSPSFGLIVSFRAKAKDDGRVDEVRAAFVVSKKIDRRSAVRHAVKRKLADAAAAFLPRVGKNTELVFLAKQKAVVAGREELISETEIVLKRARLVS